MDKCPVQEESKTLIHLTLQKPEISAGSMGHLTRKGFSFIVRIGLIKVEHFLFDTRMFVQRIWAVWNDFVLFVLNVNFVGILSHAKIA